MTICLCMLCTTSYLSGQNSLRVLYNDVHIGRNVSLLFHRSFGKHELFIGPKWHINRRVHDNQNNIFRKRFHARSFLQHIGLQFGYKYNFPIHTSTSILYLFYDNQFTSAQTRGVYFIPHTISNDTVLYTRELWSFQTIKAMEQNLGLGLLALIRKNVFLNVQAGAGIALFWDYPSRIAPDKFLFIEKTAWEFSGLISLGLQYRFE